MKLTNMLTPSGYPAQDQIIIYFGNNEIFVSYGTNIALKTDKTIYLDEKNWNYSRTTSKYRNMYLNETTKETEAKIKSGEYVLTDLN